MGLKDLRDRWAADPNFQAAYKAEYPYEPTAAAIAELRATLGLSQADLAGLIGSTQSVISRAESGQHSFQISLLQRIAEATGASWEPTFNVGPASAIVLSFTNDYPIGLSAPDIVLTFPLFTANAGVGSTPIKPAVPWATRVAEPWPQSAPAQRKLAAVA